MNPSAQVQNDHVHRGPTTDDDSNVSSRQRHALLLQNAFKIHNDNHGAPSKTESKSKFKPKIVKFDGSENPGPSLAKRFKPPIAVRVSPKPSFLLLDPGSSVFGTDI